MCSAYIYIYTFIIPSKIDTCYLYRYLYLYHCIYHRMYIEKYLFLMILAIVYVYIKHIYACYLSVSLQSCSFQRLKRQGTPRTHQKAQPTEGPKTAAKIPAQPCIKR